MSRTISTILNLKNNMSPSLVKVGKDLKGVSKQTRSAALQIKHMADSFQKKVSGMVSSAGKLAKAGAGIAGAFALKTGLSEAMDLEGFRTQLETATKDAKRAGEVMKYAVNLANKTPFEGGELVEAASSLEMFGLRSERWLPVLGDAAAGVNRSMADVQSGFIKAATTGDFASLRDTLGVTKEMVEEFAKTNLGGGFLNAKGQVRDVKKLQDALEGLLNQRYAGGMEKLAGTTKGVWSTITGITKNSLARIVGMQNDGTVKAGSLLDTIKKQASILGDLLQKWQGDGTLDRIADGATKAFQSLLAGGKRLAAFAVRHKKTIAAFGAALAGLFAGSKLVSGIQSVVNGVKLLKNVLLATSKGALLFSPAGWVVLGVTALAVGFVKLYQSSEKFRNRVNALAGNLKNFALNLKTGVVAACKELSAWFGEKIAPSLAKFGAGLSALWVKCEPFVTQFLQIQWTGFLQTLELIGTLAETAFGGFVKWLEGAMTALGGLGDLISGLCNGDLKLAGEGLKTMFGGILQSFEAMAKTPINMIIDGLNRVISGVNSIGSVKMPDWLGGKTIGISIPEIPHFALGTQYFTGGPAVINERGGELVSLPNGARVTPADKSRPSGGVTVNVTVQGNVIGNARFADYLGGVVCARVKTALANV